MSPLQTRIVQTSIVQTHTISIHMHFMHIFVTFFFLYDGTANELCVKCTYQWIHESLFYHFVYSVIY